MNKIILSATIALVSATAVTGLLTKNKISGLQQNLSAMKLDVASSRKTAADSKLALTKVSDELRSATTAVEEGKAKLADAAKEKDDAVANEKKAEELSGTQTKRIAELEEQLKNNPSKPGDPNIDEKYAALQTERDTLKTALAEAQQAVDTQAKKTTETQQQLAAATEKIRHYEKNVAKMGLTGRVVSVNPGWNFMVIDLGDKQGAAPNSQVYISRNGQSIARATITSVEPTASVASVVPSSLPRGEAVQPGDQVIFGRM